MFVPGIPTATGSLLPQAAAHPGLHQRHEERAGPSPAGAQRAHRHRRGPGPPRPRAAVGQAGADDRAGQG